MQLAVTLIRTPTTELGNSRVSTLAGVVVLSSNDSVPSQMFSGRKRFNYAFPVGSTAFPRRTKLETYLYRDISPLPCEKLRFRTTHSEDYKIVTKSISSASVIQLYVVECTRSQVEPEM